ncbi:MAG: TetR/AcrR family transcriptional regulator [Paludibacteraceae bacterium]|nr:TetR/AcrR family transcriptional regulator [Paludibacteraceae bacterium]MBR6520336.1 TetR/AcrR family transcriptional regulator [Paludibacteraceae bacterium]
MCTDLRSKILKTAGELFFKFGIRSVSIDDICNELHISKKTFYTVFKQKDELVVEMLNAMHQKKEKDYQSVLDSSVNVLDLLMQSFKKLRHHSVEKHLAFGYDLEKFYPELWHERQIMLKEMDLKYMAQMLRTGIEQGMYREDLNIEATSLLLANLIPNILKELMQVSMNTAQRVDFVLDMLVRMICNEKGMEYYIRLKVEN